MTSRNAFHLTSRTNVTPSLFNLSPFKIHGFRRADNQMAGNTLSHMQTLGYRVRYSPEYVIIVYKYYIPEKVIVKMFTLRK